MKKQSAIYGCAPQPQHAQHGGAHNSARCAPAHTCRAVEEALQLRVARAKGGRERAAGVVVAERQALRAGEQPARWQQVRRVLGKILLVG